MTFSLAGRCATTGRLGIVVTSSSPCVASRCAWVRAGAGAVGTQNITDPRLGTLGLDLLAQGFGAVAVRDQLVAAGAFADYRQLTVIDFDGATAHHSGARTLGTHAVAEGRDCVAAGNLLANHGVPAAMVRAFEATAGQHLAERLLAAVEAGAAAGGEEGPVRSVGLMVADRWSWPTVDLRVDWHDEPLVALRALWDVYRPQMDAYIQRALDPREAPSYGVPGDP